MAKLLNGKEIASEIQDGLRSRIEATRADYPNFRPGLTIVQVGDREDSNVYIRQKLKSAEAVGINAQHLKLPNSTTQYELIAAIQKLNADAKVHGMIVQLPLDTTTTVDSEAVLNTISPEKDVDGLHGSNAGSLARGDLSNCIIPCTPRGCLELIKRSGIDVSGKRAVVLGRSKIVGAPMANLLTWHNATVTVCHSKTVNLPEVVKEGDIVVVAIGKPELVKGDWLKPGAVVIDCGINSIPDASKASGKKLVGDVDFESARQVASYITPVPGGVGPMTVSMLLSNTMDAALRAASLKAT